MAKKKTEGPLAPPNLTVSKEEALQKLNKLIEQGKSYYDKEITSEKDFEETNALISKWINYCKEMLNRYFDNKLYANDFEYAGLIAVVITPWTGEPSLGEEIKRIRDELAAKIQELESIEERMELIPGPMETIRQSEIPQKVVMKGRTIFIVHGHDEAAKQAVARFLGKLDIIPLILHEQPDKGRTVIEKFEDYSEVGFAIVLLTPDDKCYRKDQPEESARFRARQNVIFELGYFIGKLGRGNVCALYKEGVELPSDIQGVLYVPMDPAEGWHMRLAREIKHAGIDIDLNKVL
jgi:predicted nucleotide-binding protein